MGIGAAIAKTFAEAGAKVAVNYASNKADGDRVVGEIVKAGGEASRSRRMSPSEPM